MTLKEQFRKPLVGIAPTRWALTALAVFLLMFFSVHVFATPQYSKQIKDQAEFLKLAGNPLSGEYAGLRSMKLVYHIKRGTLYFANSQKFEAHYDFCRQVLHFPGGVDSFNQRQYTQSKKRDYYLATLSKQGESDNYILEFSYSDEISANGIQVLYNELIKKFYGPQKISLLVNNSRLQNLRNQLVDIPLIHPGDLYGDQTLQIIGQGKTIGQLIKVDAKKFDPTLIKPWHIVLLQGSLLHIPPSAGIITTDFQTPLSHMAVLSRNRGTVLIADRTAWTSKKYDPWVGQWLELTADNNAYQLHPTKSISVQEWQRKNQASTITLALDLTHNQLQPMTDISYESINSVGGKAANFSELVRALANSKSGAKTPENAFAIPFYFYERHLRHHKIDSKIANLIQNIRSNAKVDIEQELKAIRKAIKTAPVEASLIQQIEQQINAGGFKNMRFRSSTNAEDIEDFSGAGLYDSTSVILGDPKKTIARALKKVWASTWNHPAFLEREYYHIDQATVAMGILVHRSFPSEKANGVAITKNLYRDDYPAFVINVQLGEQSVVQPKPGVTVDQLMSFQGVSDANSPDHSLDGPPRYISYSSLNKGKPILTDAQVLQLTQQLAVVKKYFYSHIAKYRRKYKYENFALDIEFKLYGDGQFYIKQARLFNE